MFLARRATVGIGCLVKNMGDQVRGIAKKRRQPTEPTLLATSKFSGGRTRGVSHAAQNTCQGDGDLYFDISTIVRIVSRYRLHGCHGHLTALLTRG